MSTGDKGRSNGNVLVWVCLRAYTHTHTAIISNLISSTSSNILRRRQSVLFHPLAASQTRSKAGD